MEKTKGLISVIIPSYNYANFIKETLDSLILQSYQSWECIIVDDGSTDNTKDVINEFIKKDNRFKYIYQKNQGQSAAKDAGLKIANGEFIQFLDADDLLASEKFKNQIEIFNSHNNVDIVYSNVRFFRSENLKERLFSMEPDNKPWMVEFSGEGQMLLQHIIKGNTMVINSPLFKSNLISEVGLFIKNPGFNEDWDFWLRCAFKNKYFYYDNNDSSWALVRIHSTSSSKKVSKMHLAGVQVRNQIRNYLREISDLTIYEQLRSLNEELMINAIKSSLRILFAERKLLEFLKYCLLFSIQEKKLWISKYSIRLILSVL